MLEKLQAIARRLDQVERQLSDPAIYADREMLTRLSREQKELTPIAAAFRAWQQAEDDCAQAQELLTDPEMRELAQEELRRARQERDRLSEELKRLLLPRDPNDDRNVILEVRAGIGGEEGALFAADLLRMYALYAERRGWNMELVYENTTELGGVKEASATIEGQGAWSRLKFEAGTHRVQRVPETESSGRIQTSAATVAVHARGRGGGIRPSTPRTYRSTPSAPPVPAASTSTKRNPPSASPTCPPARWWSARTSAASIKTRTGP